MWNDVGAVLKSLNRYFTEFELFRIQDAGITPSHIAVALVSFVLSLVVSRILRSLLRAKLFPKLRLDAGLEYAFLRFVHYAVIAIGVYMGLQVVNIPLGALVGLFAIVGVGVGFGLQNLAANFISGIILLVERPVKVGDRIHVEGVWGDVETINLRTTVITTPDNISVLVPNSKLLENAVTNYYFKTRRIRLRIPVGVAYGSDVDLVTRLLKRAGEESDEVLKDPPPDVWFLEFGDSSLNFEVLCWTADAARKYSVINDVNRRIDALFRENGVEIPFPQHDLHFRSGEIPVRLADAERQDDPAPGRQRSSASNRPGRA